MIDILVNTDGHVVVPLSTEGIPLIPDANSVTYTVHDHQGIPIIGYTDLPLATGPATHTLAIPVPVEINSISPSKRFERRSIQIRFTKGGIIQRFIQGYRVVPLVSHNVTIHDVREFLGLSKSDLKDESIDLMTAYFKVEDDISPVSLSEMLATGTMAEMSANECIRMQAVIEVIPSLQQRMAQMESNGVFEFRRFSVMNFEALEINARSRYVNARAILTGVTPTERTLFALTTRADPITGE